MITTSERLDGVGVPRVKIGRQTMVLYAPGYDTSASDAPQLAVGSYRFVFECAGPTPRGFQGSAWRGAFGRALKSTVCVTRLEDCAACLLLRGCAYPYIFETPPSDEARKLRRYPAAPHPFVLDLPWSEGGGSHAYVLGVNLFGHAHRYLPYIVYALSGAGAAGIGAKRTAFALIEVQQRVPLRGPW
jgi:hypothetical protein